MIRNADVTIHPFLSVVKMQCFITSKTLRLCYAEVMTLRRERFSEWLNEQIQTRGWTQAEFARRASTTPATVSRVLSGENNPGLDFLQGVASALSLQPEIVLRKAGILDELVELPDEAKDWGERLMYLTAEDRAAAVAMMDQVLRFAEDRPQYRARRKKSGS